jgi:hypothetical protein
MMNHQHDDQYMPLSAADEESTGGNSSIISEASDMYEDGEPKYYEFEISQTYGEGSAHIRAPKEGSAHIRALRGGSSHRRTLNEGSSHSRAPMFARHSNMRDNLRLLLLQEAMSKDRSVHRDKVTQSTSPRSHFFETRPGRTWHYEVDAPPGHGAHEPMKMVPAVGIPEDTQHINAKLRAFRHRNTSKFKGAAAFLMANSRLRNTIRSGNLADFDEDDYHKRTAIHVDVEMVSVSSGDESSGIEDMIPMFAPLEDAPEPIVEIGEAEATQLLSRRRERRRDSFDAITAKARQSSNTARRGSSAFSNMREAMRMASAQVDGAIEGTANIIGGDVSALDGGMQTLVHDTTQVVQGKSNRFKFPKFASLRRSRAP